MEFVIFKENTSKSIENAIADKDFLLFFIVPNNFDEHNLLEYISMMSNIDCKGKCTTLSFMSKHEFINVVKYYKAAAHCLGEYNNTVKEIGAYEFDFDTSKYVYKSFDDSIKVTLIDFNSCIERPPVIFEIVDCGDGLIQIKTDNEDFQEYSVSICKDELYDELDEITSDMNNDILDPRAVMFTIG